MKKKMSYLTFYGITRIIAGLILYTLLKIDVQTNGLSVLLIIVGILAAALAVCFFTAERKPDEMDKECRNIATHDSMISIEIFAVLICIAKFVPFLDRFLIKEFNLTSYQNTVAFFIVLILIDRGIHILIREKIIQKKYGKEESFNEEGKTDA